MNAAITMSNNSDNKTFLNSRKKALRLRQLRQVRRMTSFRAPKECTSKLLQFHAEDENSEDSLNRRRRALERSNHQRRHSFRLPKEQTHLLLSKHFVEDLDQRELVAHTKEVTSGVTSLSVDTPKSPQCTHKTPQRRFGGVMQRKKQTTTPSRMSSFRLPKEQTSKVLQHSAWKQQELQDGSDSSKDSLSARPRLERRLSQTARTA